jgi:serine/threonine protein kinase
VRDATAAKNEIAVMRQLEHPNIVRLANWIVDKNYAYLLIEEMDNGDLLHHVSTAPDGFLIEPEAKRVTLQLTQGLKYLHDKVIGHGDIKLDNIFVKKSAGGGLTYKLGDFGLSVFDVNVEKQAGTPQYAAPEVFMINGPISVRKSDLWSLGVLIYTCLKGMFPYEYSSLKEHIR